MLKYMARGVAPIIATVLLVGAHAGTARAQAHAAPPADGYAGLEQRIMTVFNAARSDPKGYAATLRSYRTRFDGKIVVAASTEADVETEEGTIPVDEAIAFLDRQKPLTTLGAGTTIRLAALDHMREQSASGRTGHFSNDGSGPAERNVRHGGGKLVAEVIAYGASEAEEVVRSLIVDDGVRDRGHRILMFADHLRFAGVSCGPHPDFGTACVIDLSDTPDGKAGLSRVAIR